MIYEMSQSLRKSGLCRQVVHLSAKEIENVVEMWDVYEVVVLNDGFFDKLTFLKHNKEFYKSHRGKHTNPWTIKAAKLALNIVLGGKP